MPTITAAEALAEFDRIDRRLARKRQLIEAYLFRAAALRDPLAPEGGTAAVLAAELSAIDALQERKLVLRRAIQSANERASVTLHGISRSLADWLVWRREVFTDRSAFLARLRHHIRQARLEATRSANRAGVPAGKRDVIVHLDEKALMEQAEALEETAGELAGQVTLRNTTGTVDLPAEVGRTALEDRYDELLVRPQAAPNPGPWSTSPELCRLARDPVRKLEAIKLYRQLTGCGLLDAKQAVEHFAAGGG